MEQAENTTVQAPKAPSKKARATLIFKSHLDQRATGAYTSNKAFRAAVLTQIQKDLGVSVASAATMYNAAKKEAETANPEVGLGRDPKKEKPASTGKRGRPAKAKEAEAQPEQAAAPAEGTEKAAETVSA
jgi:hypothetical protein